MSKRQGSALQAKKQERLCSSSPKILYLKCLLDYICLTGAGFLNLQEQQF